MKMGESFCLAAHPGVAVAAAVERIEEQVRGRQQLRVDEQGGNWTLQEQHWPFSEARKRPLSSFEPSIPF
jgi:hypothetical protein